MKVSIIGAGKLGSCFAISLNKLGCEIGCIYSRTDQSAQTLANAVGAVSTDLVGCVQNSDIILISTNDDSINAVAHQIAHLGINLNNKSFIHFSGLKTSDELFELKKLGANIASFHPIQTFSAPNGTEDFCFMKGISFVFEGDAVAQNVCQELADIYEGHLYIIEKPKKALYHAAMCVVSNFSMALSQIAEDIFDDINLDKAIMMNALKPLWHTTVENCCINSGSAALTGPISRGDVQTVQSHLAQIQDSEKLEKYLSAYKELGEIVAQMSFEKELISNTSLNSFKEIFKEKHNA